MKRFLSLAVVLVMTLTFISFSATALEFEPDQVTEVSGRKYSFEENNDYGFSASTDFENADISNSYGSFQIESKDASLKSNGMKNGVPSFTLESGSIDISYIYSDRLLHAPEEEIHLVSDGGSRVDILTLEDDIKKGAIILQRSLDRKNWNSILVQTNAFENIPKKEDALYSTRDVELINGCFYRLIVAYKTGVKGDPKKILGLVSRDTYTYTRHVEVYEFYASLINDQIEALEPNTRRFSLGETIKVSEGESYSGNEEIDSKDLHYGWELGRFFVSGYSDKVNNENGDPVFLKNVGDVVTLWFNLQQNIDALNGDKSITVAYDEVGSDQHFQTEKTQFGRGMLIVRYTDYENVKHDPVMYYDYLEANTTLGADTRVQLFEEGDYEVALDYEIHKDGFAFMGSSDNYRVFFRFSVRNANCMVYPFDTKTGAELINSELTENGFYLDLAKSRYLTVLVKKEIWTEGADGLTPDTRLNTIAKDGDRYTDEGIYTITAKNQYTNQETTKRIYVGKNPILKAHMTTNYSIQELVQMVDAGAIIYEDGSIEMPPGESAPEQETPADTEIASEPEGAPEINEDSDKNEQVSDEPDTGPDSLIHESALSISRTGLVVGAIAIAVIIGLCGGLALRKRRDREKER